MTYNPAIHHRRSIRLKGYDYTQAGFYFITMCTQDRECLFGKIIDRKMILSDAGLMVETVWNEIPQYYIDFDIHAFIVMPDHIHGIIEKKSMQYPDVGAIPRDCPNSDPRDCPNDSPNDLDNNDNPQIIFNKNDYPNNIDRAGTGTCPDGVLMSIPEIVQRFKSLTTKRYTVGVKQKNWKPVVFELLGYDPEKLNKKYNLDQQLEELNTRVKNLSSEMSISTDDYDRIQSALDLKKNERDVVQGQIDAFNFYNSSTDNGGYFYLD